MTFTRYFEAVTSRSAFNKCVEAEGGQTFQKLGNPPAASSWDRRWLLACRVVRTARQDTVLPLLSGQDGATKGAELQPQIRDMIRGPDSSYRQLSESELVHRNGVSLGQIWAALRAFKDGNDRGEGSTDEQRVTKRARHATQHEGFVDSSTMRVGSSSPLSSEGGREAAPESESLRSSHDSSVGHVDMGDHGPNTLTEDGTLRLVSCLTRHILYYSTPLDSAAQSIIEFRDEKLRSTVRTSELQWLRAIDDGGLCQLDLDPESGTLELGNSRVALIEAKRRFQHIHDGRPVISDESFAQMTCEALAARLLQERRQDPE